ncbi:MAG: hydroxymethylglutaryl-CoA reductase, degradative [Candidatus Micrarchaeota archaeon]
MTSKIKWSEFYKKTLSERLDYLKENTSLDKEDYTVLEKYGSLDFDTANRMIENVVGVHALPLGIATNFKINGKEMLVPMVIEEPSVVAAASKIAELTLPEGFTASSTEPIMIGQIQLTHASEDVVKKILSAKEELITLANSKGDVIIKLGGGVKDLEAKTFSTSRGEMVCIYLHVDVRDAMGANFVNMACETLAPKIEELTGGTAVLRIISNLATKRLVKAKATFSKKALEESFKGKPFTGEEIIEKILDAHAFAEVDPYRAVTSNKGIMNGIDAVVIATGNDWRAVEAGAHSFASFSGQYKPLTKYYKNKESNLVGEIELPMQVGLVGGATRTHPLAKIALKMLGVKTANELGEVIACVGLAQNVAALRALSTEGISRGHMRLHANNIAVLAGATGEQIQIIAKKLYEEKNVSLNRAKELMKELK